MSENEQDANTKAETPDSPAEAPRKLTPLEAKKARQAVMRHGKDAPDQHTAGGGEAPGAGGPNRRTLPHRKMG